jgi:glycosyltransferase involved in cell wall biosynthesis
MKILHLANHCHEIGNGIMNVAVDLACEQARMGHQVAFGSSGGSYVDFLERRGVRHFVVAQHWRRPFAAVAGLAALRRILREQAPDVVHAHMVSGAVMARALKPAAGFALVTTVHNEWQRNAVLMGVGDAVVAVSDAVRDAMEARGVARAKLRTVRNGPLGSPRRAAPSPPLPAPSLARPAVLTVCGMYRRKGVAELIEAFAAVAGRHPAARLYLVGDGPEREAFEAQAGRLACAARIVFFGYVSRPESLIAQADVFVLASRNEPFGLVLAEAREAGCAIVATAVGGVPEVMEQGRAGLLTPPNDPAALAAAIDRVLADGTLRADLRRRAAANLQWLTCARMAEQYLAAYREAVRLLPASRGPARRPLPHHWYWRR